MRLFRLRLLLLLGALLVTAQQARAWGFWAHQRINRLAVFSLPPEMFGFYKAHIDYVTLHATDPDNRRYSVEGEAPRHYMDADHYGEYPFEIIPRRWTDAVAKYTEDTLHAYGIVPWHIQFAFYDLRDAFKEQNLERILKLSADIGHYIADANVPLHTTENYNGQMTGQKGIHGLWESRLPEIFGESYDFFVGQATYFKDPLMEAWDCVLESHAALDSVLGFESALSEKFPSDRKYSFENRNEVLTRVYSEEFCKAYHNMMAGMVERRIRSSVFRVASYWHSAWVDAGQPDLEKLERQKADFEKEKFEKKLKIQDREAGEVGMVMDAWEKLFGCCCSKAHACASPSHTSGESH